MERRLSLPGGSPRHDCRDWIRLPADVYCAVHETRYCPARGGQQPVLGRNVSAAHFFGRTGVSGEVQSSKFRVRSPDELIDRFRTRNPELRTSNPMPPTSSPPETASTYGYSTGNRIRT